MIEINEMVDKIIKGEVPDGKTQAAILQVVARMNAE